MNKKKGLLILFVLVLVVAVYFVGFSKTGNVVFADLFETKGDSVSNFGVNKVSSCETLSENSAHYGTYNFSCELHEGETLYFSGINVAMEFVGDTEIRYNINGEIFSLEKDEDVVLKNSLGDDILFKVDTFRPSLDEGSKAISFFKYGFVEETKRSYCRGLFCKLYLGDSIYLDETRLKLVTFCEERDDCEVEFKLGENDYELLIAEASSVKFGGLTINVEEISLVYDFIYFTHDYPLGEVFCEDSDSGLDYSTKGVVKGFFENEDFIYGKDPVVRYELEDSCFHYEDILVEFYCGKSNFVESVLRTCEGQCVGGKCIAGVASQIESNESSVNETTPNETKEEPEKREIVKIVDESPTVPEEKKEGFFKRFLKWIGLRK